MQNQTNNMNENYKLVIDGFTLKKTKPRTDDLSFNFGVDISLPKLIIDAPNAQKMNLLMEADYRKPIDRLTNQELTDSSYFYKIEHEHFLHDTILTVLITELETWHLSEGLIRKGVYHYDLANDKILSTNDMLVSWGMSMVPLIQEIVDKVHEPELPNYNEKWVDEINADINRLKLYRNQKNELMVVYPLQESPAMEWEAIVASF